MTGDQMAGRRAAWWAAVRGVRMGRLWQWWLMLVATYLLLYATLGRQAVLDGISAAWGSV